MMTTILFYFAGAVTLASAVMVVSMRNPLHSALSLIVSLGSVAVLFILLEASFVAAMQILVYAGAIMVLFTFVIMLLNLQFGMSARPLAWSFTKTLGGLGLGYLAAAMLMHFGDNKSGFPVAFADGSVRNIGNLLLTEYVFAFEAISMLLLVAVVGAVVLGMKREA